MSGVVNKDPIASSRQSIVFPSGTKMLFSQTVAPTGWTKVTSANDVALRLTTGTVGTGGSVAFETAFASQTPTISRPTATSGAVSGTSISIAQLPTGTIGTMNPGAGREYINTAASGYVNESAGGSWGAAGVGTQNITSAGSGSTHTHGFTQPTISIPTSSAINLDVSYVDVILATKG